MLNILKKLSSQEISVCILTDSCFHLRNFAAKKPPKNSKTYEQKMNKFVKVLVGILCECQKHEKKQ